MGRKRRDDQPTSEAAKTDPVLAVYQRAFLQRLPFLILGRRLELERLAAEAAQAEVEMAEEARARFPGRRPFVEIVREYLESGGTAGVEAHGIGFARTSIHGQELADALQRAQWIGSAQELDAAFTQLVREGLVEPDIREGGAPPWCSTYGMAIDAREKVYRRRGLEYRRPVASTNPATGWWDLQGSRAVVLSDEEREEADRS